MAASLQKAGLRAEHLSALRLSDLADAEFPPGLFFPVTLYLPDEYGREANVLAYLEARDFRAVGSTAEVLELAIDKAALKRRWMAEGIRTAPFAVIGEGGTPLSEAASLGLSFPLIAKPLREGNSRGIDASSILNNYDEMFAKLSSLGRDWGDALVESYLGGAPDFREFTVALIGDPVDGLVLPAEIRFEAKGIAGPASKIVTQAAKDGHMALASALPRGSLRDRVSSFAAAAFSVAGVRDYARCDIIQAGGELYAIEINGQPMLPDPWFAACAEAEGLDEKGYLGAIVRAAFERIAASPERKALGGSP